MIEKLIQRSGDPFADTGAWVIETLQKEYPEKDILGLIEVVAKIYALDWDGKINAFFLNSTITHHSRKGMEKVEATLDFYKSLLDETAPHTEGYCRLLGQKSKLFPAGRDNHILCGSGTFINFHHAFQPGVMLSKEALIRIFFVPLGAVSVGNLVAVIGSNQAKIEQWFVKENYDKNIQRLANKSSEGVLSSEFKNPANALFNFVQKCLAKYNEQLPEDEPVEINLYHFSNFGAEPKISLHCFSAPLFKFYRKVLNSRYKREWARFVNSHYRNENATFEEGLTEDHFLVKEKKEFKTVGGEEFKTWSNPIYNTLLRGEDILKYFKAWSTNQFKTHKPFYITHIVHLYQTFLKGMREETLKKIEAIAEFIVSDPNKRKQRLGSLRSIGNMAAFRRYLLELIRSNVEEKAEKPLISLREYVTYLFPDGAPGMEIRDLLLISVYEKLSEAQAFDDLPEEDEAPETEPESDFSTSPN
ncbi:MAG: type I-B CRISPR-associated protein Cas8b1/Cst1 [Lewinellaceae bacterium]|nr:type I-B CRISPR-associated protein Cas8b1/Cst1 [Lewinellaceae bacterium]